jgi:hypothetical protein
LALPSYNDPDGHTVYFQTTTLPAFVTYNSINKIYTFKPTALLDFGTKTFTITLTDTNAQTDYTITLNVFNNPPVYNTPPPLPTTPIYPLFSIPLNSIQTIIVPPFHDPDGTGCIVYVNELSKIGASANLNIIVTNENFGPIIVAPVGFGEVGDHIIEIILWDYSPRASDKNI